MRRLVLLPLALALACTATTEAPRELVYPEAPRGDHVDVYHGVPVPDPYRWLEDPDSPETRAWIEAENELTFDYLEAIPERDAIRARLTELWNYERAGVPQQAGGRLFYTKNDGLQNQGVLHVREPDGSERVLLDPNALSADGTIALANTVPNRRGTKLAYGLSDGGSDWRTWHFLDVATGEKLDDVLHWNKFGRVAWAHDGAGLFYARYDEPEEGALLREKNAPPDVYFHELGTAQEKDVLVYPRPREEGVNVGFQLTEDGRYLVLSHWRAADRHTELYLIDLASDDPERGPEPLITGFDAQHRFVGSLDDTFWIHTDLDAPRGRVMAIERGDHARLFWHELIPEAPESLQGVSAAGGRLFANYLVDAVTEVRAFLPDGTPERRIDLGGIGSARGFRGRLEDEAVYFSFTSFTHPTEIRRLDVASGEVSSFFTPEVDFDPEDYETRQVFFPSKDGTRIPMFLVHRRGLELDGTNPTYLFGYGGFNISMTPRFSVANLVWIEMGGVFASANLRGGGEYGEEWREAGTKLRKQNVFDDFVAAAEHLIESGVTNPDRLAIGGGSNGGLLVGACMTQRPELFGAALPAVGVMDMLRYHKFTIGWAWVGDYGSSDDPEEFRALRAYSPLHNLRAGTDYPATLVTTADRDDRVVPAHSFKFAAALQAAHAGPDPVLVRIQTRAGHGAGKPTEMRIAEAADRWAFLVHELDVEVP